MPVPGYNHPVFGRAINPCPRCVVAKADEKCAYCGAGDDLRPCPGCKRLVCWHPTCRGGQWNQGEGLVCCACAGTLPETSVDNSNLTYGKCAICESAMAFEGMADISIEPKMYVSVPVFQYRCARGHIVFVMDYGNSQARI